MNGAQLFDLSQTITQLVALSCILSAFSVCYNFYQTMKKPKNDINIRIERLEKEVEKINKFLTQDDKSLEEQAEINSLFLKSLHALLTHDLDGNNTKEIKECQEEIQNRLFNEAGKLR